MLVTYKPSLSLFSRECRKYTKVIDVIEYVPRYKLYVTNLNTAHKRKCRSRLYITSSRITLVGDGYEQKKISLNSLKANLNK